MTISNNFISELEDIVSRGSVERRVQALDYITSLFALRDLSKEQIDTLDEILIRLTMEIEVKVRHQLAVRLADIVWSPPKFTRMLAFDQEIEVASPILSGSNSLDERTIIEIIKSKNDEFLLAVSSRKELSASVTDILVSRGSQAVIRCAAENETAKFSDRGYRALVERTVDDYFLARALCARADLPQQLFLDVVGKASELVQNKLTANELQYGAEIQRSVGEVADGIRTKSIVSANDYASVQKKIKAQKALGLLNESQLEEAAGSGDWITTAVMLAEIARLPIDVVERAMRHPRGELLLIIVKSTGLSWFTTKAIFLLKGQKYSTSNGAALEQCLRDYERLKSSTAQQAIRFYLLRMTSILNAKF